MSLRGRQFRARSACGAEGLGIILSGGPNSVFEEGAPTLDPAVLELGIPILGICYGMQLVTHLLNGTVEARPGGREYGASDATGAYPHENPTTPGDITATVFHALGLDPETEIRDQLDRPMPISNGRPIHSLFA